MNDSDSTEVRRALHRKAIAEWDEVLKRAQRDQGLVGEVTVSGAEVLREVRDQYDGAGE
ncbi:hypothetical protein ACWEKT_18740 [Nocardia takedensis]